VTKALRWSVLSSCFVLGIAAAFWYSPDLSVLSNTYSSLINNQPFLNRASHSQSSESIKAASPEATLKTKTQEKDFAWLANWQEDSVTTPKNDPAKPSFNWQQAVQTFKAQQVTTRQNHRSAPTLAYADATLVDSYGATSTNNAPIRQAKTSFVDRWATGSNINLSQNTKFGLSFDQGSNGHHRVLQTNATPELEEESFLLQAGVEMQTAAGKISTGVSQRFITDNRSEHELENEDPEGQVFYLQFSVDL